jgi:hypothetical protein
MAESVDPAAYEAGVEDAKAGVPHPSAESHGDDRQPVARLEALGAHLRGEITRIEGSAMRALIDVGRVADTIGDRIKVEDDEVKSAGAALRQAPPGKRRRDAEWRLTLMVLAIALTLPFEVYLTALSLNFLDLSVSGQRVVTLGIAICVALAGLLASHRNSLYVDQATIRGTKSQALPLHRALWRASQRVGIDDPLRATAFVLALVLILGLGVLRYGAVGLSTPWEGVGALVVLGVVAAIFALWVAFVHQRLQEAEVLNTNWRRRRQIEHRLASAEDRLNLLQERRNGLATEVDDRLSEASTRLNEAPSRFVQLANSWWAGYQTTNPAAARDISGQRERMKKELERAVWHANAELGLRAGGLRTLLGEAPANANHNGSSNNHQPTHEERRADP